MTLTPLVMAGYNKGVPIDGLVSSYPSNTAVSGWLNMSFSQEPADSVFTANVQGNITLQELLEYNNISYDCNPTDCKPSYTASSSDGSTTKDFSLSTSNKLITIKVVGNFKEVISDGFSMKIQATNSDTCQNPLMIDILDDQEVDFISKNYSSDYSCKYESGYGCFSLTEQAQETEIQETPYCNKIKIPAGNSYEIGAEIKKGAQAITYDNGLLNMELYGLEGEFIDSCSFKTPGPSINGGEIGCYINYTNNDLAEYFLCLSATESSSGYITKYETSSKACGFFDNPPSQNYEANYKLYTKGAKYGNVGTIEINDTTYEEGGLSSSSLTSIITSYINEKFDGNCTEGCAIPIMISSDSQTQIKIVSSSLKYRTNVGVIETKTVYDSSKQPIRISTPYTKLDLTKANFQVGSNYGNSTLRIYYKNIEILNKKIEIKKIPVIQSIRPTSAAAYQNTVFTSTIINKPVGNNTLTYNWDFGDGSAGIQTKENSSTHKYTDIGNFTVKLTITDTQGNTNTKTSTISIGSPKTIINTTITNYKKNLNKVAVQISQLPQWQAKRIKEIIDINQSQTVLDQAIKDYTAALNEDDDEEFLSIMESLSDIYVPREINISSKATNVPYLPEEDNFNQEELQELSAETYPESENTARAINDWAEQNLEVSYDYQTIAGYSESGIDNIITTYKIRIKPITDEANKVYLIINDETAEFASDYSQTEGIGYYGMTLDLSSGEKTVEFSVEGSDTPTEIIFSISPQAAKIDLSKYDDIGEIKPCNYNNVCELQLNEDKYTCPSDCKSNTKKIWAIAAVLALAIIAYALMMWWYRNKYALHLFKNKNDYLNIMNYIYKSDKAKISKEKIMENLTKSGWKNEQIEFAWKKYQKDNKNK